MESVNCICVDWKSGSRTGYTQASQNIRIVGAEVAYFVDVLEVTTSGLYKSPCTLLSGFSSRKIAVCVIIGKVFFYLELAFSLTKKKNAKKNLDLGFINMPIKVNKLIFKCYYSSNQVDCFY